MQVRYESYSDLMGEEKGFGIKIIDEIIDNISENMVLYCQERIEYYKNKYGIEVEVNFDELRAVQAIIDALEDLRRLKDFHPVEQPNRLKCAAYLAYWWLQRQPLTFFVAEKYEEDFYKRISKKDLAKFIHVNALWIEVYVLGELFTESELPCAGANPTFQKQWDIELDYLFYYFCYRADSAKSIEAFLSTAILHPIWAVKDGVYFVESDI